MTFWTSTGGFSQLTYTRTAKSAAECGWRHHSYSPIVVPPLTVTV